MDSAETRLKSLAVRLGADLVGITNRDLLSDGPPSTDPRYLLPSANSVISFAISLDRDIVQDFISKKKWRPHWENRKAIAQKLYTIGDKLAEQLRSEGYEAVNVDLNNSYRPEEAAADVTETISRKRPNTCCWISCTGYEGLATSLTWSNWSPYRLGHPLPENREELNALCISLQKADPQMQDVDNSFSNYRETIFDPDWFYYTVCGFCRSVCSPRREDRLANRKLIINSGTAALKLDGSHKVADEDTVEMRTPFGLRVVVGQEDLTGSQAKARKWPNLSALTMAVGYRCRNSSCGYLGFIFC